MSTLVMERQRCVQVCIMSTLVMERQHCVHVCNTCLRGNGKTTLCSSLLMHVYTGNGKTTLCSSL